MTFAAFFTHPFVNLECAPSEKSLSRARDLAQRAEKCADKVGAMKLYCQSFDHYLSALQYIDGDRDREAVRKEFC